MMAISNETTEQIRVRLYREMESAREDYAMAETRLIRAERAYRDRPRSAQETAWKNSAP